MTFRSPSPFPPTGATLAGALPRAGPRPGPVVVCVLALLGLAAPAAAQSVADYYHAAAQLYIGEQNQRAEAAAEAGLALDPDDAKLRALLEKIREQEEGQGGGGQQAEDADDRQPGEGDEQQDGGEDGEEPQPDAESPGEQGGEPQPGEPQPRDQPAPDEREADAGAEGDEQPDAQPGDGGTATPFEVPPGEMSRAEAERILRAIQTDELELLRDVQRRRARPRYVEKDW